MDELEFVGIADEEADMGAGVVIDTTCFARGG